MSSVITRFEPPPIPVRHFDWLAFIDGEEEGGPTGYGLTELDAVKDLAGGLASVIDQMSKAKP